MNLVLARGNEDGPFVRNELCTISMVTDGYFALLVALGCHWIGHISACCPVECVLSSLKEKRTDCWTGGAGVQREAG